jgi:hypothetical protein
MTGMPLFLFDRAASYLYAEVDIRDVRSHLPRAPKL